MDPDQIPTIFKQFTQLDNSSSRKYGGAGLGLTICKRIVEAMGGTIEVESEAGKGTTVRVKLSFSQSLDAAPKTVSKEKPVLPRDVEGRTFRVLLAEDSPTNQMVVKGMLEHTGYLVDTAANGKEAVEAVESLPYDVILMDVSMPEMDGLEATRRIRSLGKFDDLPIVALTANAMKEDEERTRDAGMSDYLAKPVDKQTLLLALARSVGIQNPAI